MWSTIGATTARQARVAGSLLVRRATLFALQAGARIATTSIVPKTVIVPTSARIPAFVVRGYATKASAKTRKTTKRGRATKAKKTTAKKAVKKKKKPVKRAKKTTKQLTEEEKQALKIKLLKKRALLKEPDRLPTTQWTVYFSQRVKEETAGKKRDEDLPSLKSIMQKISAEYKALSAAELEKLQATADQNKITNDAVFRKWVESHTAQEIHDANYARGVLRRLGVIRKPTIPDTRFPRAPLRSFSYFMRDRFNAPELANLPAPQRMRKIAEAWKKLSPAERKPYDEHQAVDVQRYKKELETLRKQ